MTTEQTSAASFTLKYDGPALAQGSMSTRDLGPALQAIGDLFDRASELVHLEDVNVDVQVTATRQESFDVELTLELFRVTYSMLGSSSATAAVNLVQIVMLAISILKGLRGDRSEFRQQETEATGQREPTTIVPPSSFSLKMSDELGLLDLSLDASDDTMRRFASEALSVVGDRQSLQHIRKVAEPVRRNGVDSVSIIRPDGVTESIEEEDLPYFGPFPEDDEPIRVSVLTQWLTVVSPNLSETDGRWRFRDGGKVNWYAITDSYFAEKVADRSIVFRAGDVLECEVRRTKRIGEDGKDKTEYEVIKVVAKLPMDDQGSQLSF